MTLQLETCQLFTFFSLCILQHDIDVMPKGAETGQNMMSSSKSSEN